MKTPLLSSLRRAFRLAQSSRLQPQKPLDALIFEQEKRAMSRRHFLKSTAQGGVLLGLGGTTTAREMWAETAQPFSKIAIVGAGMAGLSAGYHLQRKGIKATLFEADKRVGGRIKSARIFDNGNLNTEIGAEFIDSVHLDMLALVRELGLENKLIDLKTDTTGARDAFFIGTQHYSLANVVAEFVNAYPRIQADQRKAAGRHKAAFDRLSMAEYIEAMPVSNWVKQMLHAAYIGENGLETAEQSAANLLSVFQILDGDFLPFGESDERFKLSGGNEQLTQALAKKLGDQIRSEHKLLRLRENSNRSITLTFSENGTTREDTFDAVMLTLPFSVLRDLEIQMDLPVRKQRVIKELGYGTNAKFILETRERTWRQAGYQGFLFNEKVHNGWDSAQLQQDNTGTGAYTCFFGGNRGKSASKENERELLAYSMPALEGAFPGTKTSLTGKMEVAAWPSNPFVRGSYSCFRPGQALPFEGVAAERVRRLYFAGEHCSIDFWGFMNGAAETGQKAAEKILHKMRVK